MDPWIPTGSAPGIFQVLNSDAKVAPTDENEHNTSTSKNATDESLLTELGPYKAEPLIREEPFEINFTSYYNETINSSYIDSSLEEVQYWSEPWRIFFSVTLILIIIASVVGNVMVVMVIVRHRGMRTRTNMFLCSLACSDLLCATLNMPLSLITMIYGKWIFGPTLCQINGFLTPFTFVTSIHTLMYIAVHKYMSIRKPFNHVLTHFRILLMILCAWLWGIVASYLTVHGLNAVSYKAYTTQCGPDYPHDVRTYFHEALIYATCYLIPLGVMAVCYTVMYYEIKRHALRMVLSTTTDKDVIYMQQRRITFTLFLVLLTFMLCWTPHVIYAAYTTAKHDKASLSSLANPIVYWLGYLNCACNPLIYALRSPAFREGYRQLFCCSQQPKEPRHSTRAQHRPLGRFRQFLRDNLRGTLHASGSLTGSPAVSPPTSRKSSMTSLTNYLLFPKSRTLSTNSLPGNFRFSVPLPLVDKDTTQVSFIAGIPVLTKGGKIVTYINPHEAALKRRTNPVYYPRVSQLERKLLTSDPNPVGAAAPSETSPLIAHAQHVPRPPPHLGTCALSPHVEVPEIFIEPDIEGELREMGPDMPRFTARPSCESGFNDVDNLSEDEHEDQVFIVVADIERPPRDVSASGSSDIEHLLEDTTLDSTCLDDLEPSVGEGHVAELLSVPGPSITRQRICKSVSDACDRKRPVMVGKLVTKSTSDTCIQENMGDDHLRELQPLSTSSTQNGEKKSTDKSIRRKFLNRFFSRGKTKGGGSPKSSIRGSRIDMHGEEIVDDISDSGMVSGVLQDSPAAPQRGRRQITDKSIARDLTSHSFSAADSRQRHTLDRTTNDKDQQQQSEDTISGHRVLALSRSSSDPSMTTSKSKSSTTHSKHRQHDHKQRASKIRSKSRRSHDNKIKRRSRDSELNLINSGVVTKNRIELGRSKSMKAGKYPSVEQLDRVRLGSDASALKRKQPKQRAAHGSSPPRSANQASVFSAHVAQQAFLPHNLHQHQKLFRCVSDPGLTFRRIEEKVLQRSITRKWQRTHRRGHRRTTTDAVKEKVSVLEGREFASFDARLLSSGGGGPTTKSSPGVRSRSTTPVQLAQARTVSPDLSLTTPSHDKHSGKYLLITVPINEASPICLSNLSLHRLSQSENTIQGHMMSSDDAMGGASGHVTTPEPIMFESLEGICSECGVDHVTIEGSASHQMCSLSFVQGVPAQLSTSESLEMPK